MDEQGPNFLQNPSEEQVVETASQKLAEKNPQYSEAHVERKKADSRQLQASIIKRKVSALIATLVCLIVFGGTYYRYKAVPNLLDPVSSRIGWGAAISFVIFLWITASFGPSLSEAAVEEYGVLVTPVDPTQTVINTMRIVGFFLLPFFLAYGVFSASQIAEKNITIAKNDCRLHVDEAALLNRASSLGDYQQDYMIPYTKCMESKGYPGY